MRAHASPLKVQATRGYGATADPEAPAPVVADEPAEDALQICRGAVDSVLVSEEEIGDGMRFLYAGAKLACEPAGAAAAAAVLAGKVELAGPTVVVVSGGNSVPEQAAAILDSR